MTPKEIFVSIKERIQSNADEVKAEIDGIFRFEITGDDGGTWIVDCKEVDVREADEAGEVTITVTDADFVAINDGSLDAMQAFMMGQIQVEGDMGLAMKLQQVL